MIISDNSIVSLHYKLMGSDQQVLDSTENQEPLVYMHNTGGLLAGLQDALSGSAAGDILTVHLTPEQAYGVHHPELVQELPLAAFDGQSISAGMYFDAKDKDGNSQRLVVKKVTLDKVTVDANHPLAGQSLHFDVVIMDVRDPTAEELEQGQPQ